MYQVLHDTNNVTDSGCHCVSADQSSRAVGSGSVASSSELFTVVRPSIWDESSDIKIGQLGRPWLVWYVPCKRRCVPRLRSLPTPPQFTKLKHRRRHRNANDRRWRCETHSVGTQWQSVGELHDAIFTVSDELSLESPIKWQLNVLLQSLATILQIYQSIFQINQPERKTVYSEPCHVLRGEKCPDASRIFALKYRVRRDLNTDVSVFAMPDSNSRHAGVS